ncbi:MAG: class I SAM-dependent methyltransferase [Gammaproteobacteria bacterium]
MQSLIDKWNRIYSGESVDRSPASAVLTENEFLLPHQGSALDLACGLGGNAVYLAERGLSVTAWDISPVAIEKLNEYAGRQRLPITGRQQYIDSSSFAERDFDVVVVSRFLDRDLKDAIINALKPDGLLFYQTFIRDKVGSAGPTNPDYLLSPNELLRMFSSLRVVFYRENGLIGNTDLGLRDEAQFIGQKQQTQIVS